MRILISGRRADGRSALALFLRHKPNLDVVAEATDVQSLLEGAQAIQPDAVLLDWELCDRPLRELVSRLHQIESRPGVVLINAPPDSKPAALASGPEAVVVKGDQPRSLLLAIETVHIRRKEEGIAPMYKEPVAMIPDSETYCPGR